MFHQDVSELFWIGNTETAGIFYKDLKERIAVDGNIQIINTISEDKLEELKDTVKEHCSVD